MRVGISEGREAKVGVEGFYQMRLIRVKEKVRFYQIRFLVRKMVTTTGDVLKMNDDFESLFPFFFFSLFLLISTRLFA